jgi:hypothetical protein
VSILDTIFTISKAHLHKIMLLISKNYLLLQFFVEKH